MVWEEKNYKKNRHKVSPEKKNNFKNYTIPQNFAKLTNTKLLADSFVLFNT